MTKNKYHAKPTVVDGIRFVSMREASRYGVLKIMERAGEISGLELQPKFPCVVNGQKVCTYIADFRYTKDGAEVIEDVKGVKTAVYRIKKKLVGALHGIEIVEV